MNELNDLLESLRPEVEHILKANAVEHALPDVSSQSHRARLVLRGAARHKKKLSIHEHGHLEKLRDFLAVHRAIVLLGDYKRMPPVSYVRYGPG